MNDLREDLEISKVGYITRGTTEVTLLIVTTDAKARSNKVIILLPSKKQPLNLHMPMHAVQLIAFPNTRFERQQNHLRFLVELPIASLSIVNFIYFCR